MDFFDVFLEHSLALAHITALIITFKDCSSIMNSFDVSSNIKRRVRTELAPLASKLFHRSFRIISRSTQNSASRISFLSTPGGSQVFLIQLSGDGGPATGGAEECLPGGEVLALLLEDSVNSSLVNQESLLPIGYIGTQLTCPQPLLMPCCGMIVEIGQIVCLV